MRAGAPALAITSPNRFWSSNRFVAAHTAVNLAPYVGPPIPAINYPAQVAAIRVDLSTVVFVVRTEGRRQTMVINDFQLGGVSWQAQIDGLIHQHCRINFIRRLTAVSKKVLWYGLIGLWVNHKIEVDQCRGHAVGSGKFNQRLATETGKIDPDGIINAGEIAVEELRHKNFSVFMIKQQQGRAIISILVTRICNQYQAHLMITEEVETIVPAFPFLLFLVGKFARATMHLTRIEVVNVRLPPRGISERFQFANDLAHRGESFRQLTRLVVGFSWIF